MLSASSRLRWERFMLSTSIRGCQMQGGVPKSPPAGGRWQLSAQRRQRIHARRRIHGTRVGSGSVPSRRPRANSRSRKSRAWLTGPTGVVPPMATRFRDHDGVTATNTGRRNSSSSGICLLVKSAAPFQVGSRFPLISIAPRKGPGRVTTCTWPPATGKAGRSARLVVSDRHACLLRRLRRSPTPQCGQPSGPWRTGEKSGM